MFLTQTQINKLREKVENDMSSDIKLIKAQINKLIKERGALGSILARFLPKLTKPAISLEKRISGGISATDAAIQKKVHGYGTKTVRFSNKDLDDMIKIVEDSDVLIKEITETLKNDIKKGRALPLIPMLLGTLGASLLTGRRRYKSGNQGQELFRSEQGI